MEWSIFLSSLYEPAGGMNEAFCTFIVHVYTTAVHILGTTRARLCVRKNKIAEKGGQKCDADELCCDNIFYLVSFGIVITNPNAKLRLNFI